MLSTFRNWLLKFGTLTLLWAIFIILSASFMRQIYNFAISFLNREFISYLLFFLLALLAALGLYKVYCLKSWWRTFLVLIPIVGMGALAFSMSIIEERTHIIKYGVLGYMAAFNLLGRSQCSTMYAVLNGILFCFFTSSLDEGFQAILPYRVGDLRDIAFDCLSACAGVLVALVTAETRISKN